MSVDGHISQFNSLSNRSLFALDLGDGMVMMTTKLTKTAFRPNSRRILLLAVVLSCLCLWLTTNVCCWSLGRPTPRSPRTTTTAAATTRRSFLRDVAVAIPAVVIAPSVIGVMNPPIVSAATGSSDDATTTATKILVLGGTGFVGRRVVEKLRGVGIQVVATSRDGRDGTVAFDVLAAPDSNEQKVRELSKGCAAVISCIGAIGTSEDVRAVNAATGYAAKGAKSSGVQRFVYISVAPEVKRSTEGIGPLQNYMNAKIFSEQSVLSTFSGPGEAIIIEPTFIFGGDEFSVNPPRVAGFYGRFVESILSSGPIRAVTNVLPEGFIKIALEPPVSVDDVAGAACAAALGKSTETELDTHDKIVGASKKLA